MKNKSFLFIVILSLFNYSCAVKFNTELLRPTEKLIDPKLPIEYLGKNDNFIGKINVFNANKSADITLNKVESFLRNDFE